MGVRMINDIAIPDMGSLRMFVIVFSVLCLLDIITGLLNAVLAKEVESHKLKTGLVGKIYEYCVIAVAFLLGKLFSLDQICIATLVFYIAQEGISILENTAKHIKYPKVILEVLKKISSKGGNEDGVEKECVQ